MNRPPAKKSNVPKPKTPAKKQPLGRLDAAVEAVKKRMVVAALKQHAVLTRAALFLGITESTLRDLMRRQGIRRSVKITKTVKVTVANP